MIDKNICLVFIKSNMKGNKNSAYRARTAGQFVY